MPCSGQSAVSDAIAVHIPAGETTNRSRSPAAVNLPREMGSVG
jgi:hypothetical protein